MPVDRADWAQRIKAVERQYKTARLAIERLRAQSQNDASIVLKFPDARNVKETLKNLESTYVVRIFVLFENGMRSYWQSKKPGKKPDMKPPMNAIGSKCKIPNAILKEAHEVREYRNQIVHQRKPGEAVIYFAMHEVQSRLSKYFDRLPFQW